MRCGDSLKVYLIRAYVIFPGASCIYQTMRKLQDDFKFVLSFCLPLLKIKGNLINFIEQIRINFGHDWLRNQKLFVCQTRFLHLFSIKHEIVGSGSPHHTCHVARDVAWLSWKHSWTSPWSYQHQLDRDMVGIKFLSPAKHLLTGRMSMISLK